MHADALPAGGLRTVGSGTARTGDPATAGRRAACLYADPAAWLVVASVEAALTATPPDVRARAAEFGVLAVSAHGTRHTMRELAASADRGRVSPLRFAGANPASLAGLPCIAFGFRGPSLLLCMRPGDARSIVAITASGWLASGQCRYVVVAEHTEEDGTHTVTSRVLATIALYLEGEIAAPAQ
ncbi:beta-ketoacyl synthase N-terminal-like domain-containing protein [Spongiactinospora sp. TRM90649]|uniref:beta-ketoacyl synthase N-terminal-like domain-containing protein n=1 Tax=Spongiactinospora sp. TRM90649 TaxID=3031114 RepID=UPI0023F97860|nr:beta-ketoacyl synthase N-terminal-like domain-containing protein [Spongiactinospora sp. TRM90649]MDF5755756.1 beta-ketoacyl synthase N-terminal-like domain-containing protein [Spongiactinospora sp. TRM90649]